MGAVPQEKVRCLFFCHWTSFGANPFLALAGFFTAFGLVLFFLMEQAQWGPVPPPSLELPSPVDSRDYEMLSRWRCSASLPSFYIVFIYTPIWVLWPRFTEFSPQRMARDQPFGTLPGSLLLCYPCCCGKLTPIAIYGIPLQLTSTRFTAMAKVNYALLQIGQPIASLW